MHYNKVVHGDLKPDNLLMSAAGRVKITDFGSSHMFQRGDTMLRTMGTPAFMAPEMCVGGNFHGRTCDIWALGICLYMFHYGTLLLLDLPKLSALVICSYMISCASRFRSLFDLHAILGFCLFRPAYWMAAANFKGQPNGCWDVHGAFWPRGQIKGVMAWETICFVCVILCHCMLSDDCAAYLTSLSACTAVQVSASMCLGFVVCSL